MCAKKFGQRQLCGAVREQGWQHNQSFVDVSISGDVCAAALVTNSDASGPVSSLHEPDACLT